MAIRIATRYLEVTGWVVQWRRVDLDNWYTCRTLYKSEKIAMAAMKRSFGARYVNWNFRYKPVYFEIDKT